VSDAAEGIHPYFVKGKWKTDSPRVMSAEIQRLVRVMTAEEMGDRAAGYAASAYRAKGMTAGQKVIAALNEAVQAEGEAI
jgi:hypothetical protein